MVEAKAIYLKISITTQLFTTILRATQKNNEHQKKYELSVPIIPQWTRLVERENQYLCLIDNSNEDYLDIKISKIMKNRGKYVFILGDRIDGSRSQGRYPVKNKKELILTKSKKMDAMVSEISKSDLSIIVSHYTSMIESQEKEIDGLQIEINNKVKELESLKAANTKTLNKLASLTSVIDSETTVSLSISK